jgi:hypothetical protein
MDPDQSDAAALARDLLPRLRRWDSAGWSVAAELPGAGTGAGRPSRAHVAAAVVQRLADVAADAEGQPRRTVPLLAEVNLADQLTVMVDDILRTGDPAALRAAATALAALRAALGYR